MNNFLLNSLCDYLPSVISNIVIEYGNNSLTHDDLCVILFKKKLRIQCNKFIFKTDCDGLLENFRKKGVNLDFIYYPRSNSNIEVWITSNTHMTSSDAFKMDKVKGFTHGKVANIGILKTSYMFEGAKGFNFDIRMPTGDDVFICDKDVMRVIKNNILLYYFEINK